MVYRPVGQIAVRPYCGKIAVRVVHGMAEAPISARPHVFYVRPAPGWLDLTFAEVQKIAQTPLQKYKYEAKVSQLMGTVKVHRCDWRQGLEIMQRLTTAHDMEWLILESKAVKWDDVDAVIGRVPWDEILPGRDANVHVNADTDGGFTTSSGKIRENFCKIGKLKHVTEGADFRFKTDLRGELLRILISLAGEPLYKRGYKTNLTAVAPLTEHQATACIRYALGETPVSEIGAVYVPFAGSGTFGFEALNVIGGAGPGSFQRKFACERFPCTPAPTMGWLRRKMTETFAASASTLPPVFFNDFNNEAIDALKENVAAFPHGKFDVNEGDAFEWKPELPKEGKILALLNPPYGERLAQDSGIPELFGKLGVHMHELAKANPGRFIGVCLCPDDQSWSKFLKGLNAPTAQTHHFTHGGKEMRAVRWRS